MGMGIHIDLRRRWYRIRNVTTIGRMTLSGEREPEAIARRRVLSLLGLFGVLGLVAPHALTLLSLAPYSSSTSRTEVSGMIPPRRRAKVFAPFCSHSPATHFRAKSSHCSPQSPS